MLICHHTHTLQTIEDFHGKRIFYSIGNFIFDQQKPLNSKACIVRLRIEKDGFQVETVPIEIRQCVPYLSLGFNSSGESLVNMLTLGPSFVKRF